MYVYTDVCAIKIEMWSTNSLENNTELKVLLLLNPDGSDMIGFIVPLYCSSFSL